MPQVSCTIPWDSSQIVKKLSKLSGESQSSILAQAIENGLPDLTEKLLDRTNRLDRLVGEIFEEGEASGDGTGERNA
jgi:hypothetical protein